MTGEKNDGYLIGVSNEVPEELKDLFAINEYTEFMMYGLEDLERTLHSEQNIMRILRGNQEKARNYAKNKLILYEDLTKYSKGNLDKFMFSEQDFNGFFNAANYLKQFL